MSAMITLENFQKENNNNSNISYWNAIYVRFYHLFYINYKCRECKQKVFLKA
jgi:hypothetical protein